jgi:hypothetical protein
LEIVKILDLYIFGLYGFGLSRMGGIVGNFNGFFFGTYVRQNFL